MEDHKIARYVADLARIDISSEEEKFLGSQLSRILEYIDKLKEVDVDGIEPMRGLHLQKNVFREDQVKIYPFREDIIANAPKKDGNYFKIPPVID